MIESSHIVFSVTMADNDQSQCRAYSEESKSIFIMNNIAFIRQYNYNCIIVKAFFLAEHTCSQVRAAKWTESFLAFIQEKRVVFAAINNPCRLLSVVFSGSLKRSQHVIVKHLYA